MNRLKTSVLLLDAALLGFIGRQFVPALWAAGAGNAAFVTQEGVAFDVSSAGAGWGTYAAVRAGAPIFSALVAIVGGIVFKYARSEGMRLFALYLAAVGVVALSGDVFAVVIGSFDDIGAAMNMPSVLLRALATAPLAILLVLAWQIGVRFQPALDAIVVPALAVAVLMPVVCLPASWPSIAKLWLGQAPWIVVLAGSITSGSGAWNRKAGRVLPGPLMPAAGLRISSPAWALALLLILVVRLMVQGVSVGFAS